MSRLTWITEKEIERERKTKETNLETQQDYFKSGVKNVKC